MQAMLEKYKKINRKGKPAGAPMSVASVAGRGPAAHPVRPVEDEAPKHPMHSVLSRVRAAVKEEAATTASTAAAAAHAAEVVPSSSGEGGSSLAILVLIIDEFPHEALWRLWLQRGGVHERGRVRFFFHAKFPDRVRSPWVKERLVDFSFRPQWGSVEITKAMFALLRRAVRDDAAELEGVGAKHEEVGPGAGGRLRKFAFASESCVPVVPLTEALARVFASDHGWMRLKAKANNGYSQNKQFDVLRGKLPADCICKADQWALLNRRQANDLLRLPALVEAHEHAPPPAAAAEKGVHTSSQPQPEPEPEPEKPTGKEVRIERAPPGLDPQHWRGEKKLLALFSKVGASDEMFLPTCLALLGHVTVMPGAGGKPHLATAAGVGLDDRPLTYCDWEDNPTNPSTFHSLTKGLARERDALATAHKARCIFFRKLKADPHRSPPTSLPFGPEQSPHEHVALDWFRAVYPGEDEEAAVKALREVYVEVRTGKRAVAVEGGDGGGGAPSNKRMRR